MMDSCRRPPSQEPLFPVPGCGLCGPGSGQIVGFQITEDEVDEAGFGEETKYIFDESGNEEGQETDTGFPSSLPEDGRLRLRPDITLEGSQYSGQKSNRNEAYGKDDKKWQLLGDGMERKRRRAKHSDSENISVDELDSEEDRDESDSVQQDDEMEALTKEYTDLREQEVNLLKNLKKHADEDSRKGQAVRNQKVLVEKNNAINEAFSNGKNTLGNEEHRKNGLSPQTDAAWVRIESMYNRIAPFRDNSVDKWYRKTQLSAGASAMKSKFRAFNQSISQQVSTYMKDPTSMIKRMQLMRSSVEVVGTSPQARTAQKPEMPEKYSQEINEDGDSELLDDSEFYQQLLREFLESTDPTSLGANIYSSKKMNKKRKVVDRRASKSRKIRYNVHEKIVNFMAPEPMVLPPMAPKLFSNLFGQKNSQPV